MSSFWPVRDAIALAIAIASSRPSNAMARALLDSVRRCPASTGGSSKLGRPSGMWPTVFTPLPSRLNAQVSAAMPTIASNSSGR